LDADLFLIVTTVRTLYERWVAGKVIGELTREYPDLASYMAVQGRRGRSPNAAPEGKPGDGNIRARFRSFWGAQFVCSCWEDAITFLIA
jgi:hypothetical protein